MSRINKYLAECGVASRRAAEDLIRGGKVRVNGETVTDLAFKVTDTDTVEVGAEKVNRQPKKVYILLNKPADVVTTCNDQFNRKTVLDVIACEAKRRLPENIRLFPVGRLDYDTEGLLILTNDGGFTRQLTHPSSEIPKTYIAKLNKPLADNQLSRLRAGAGYNPPKKLNISGINVEITITEGRNRQIRRMFETIGVRVTHLKRTRIGNLTLGNLKPGEWRLLTKEEICRLTPLKK